MGADISKFGVDLEKIKDAALDDFDDYDSNELKQKQTSSFAEMNNNGVSSDLLEAALYGLDDVDTKAGIQTTQEDKKQKESERSIVRNNTEKKEKQEIIKTEKQDEDKLSSAKVDPQKKEQVNLNDTPDDSDSEWKDKLLSFHIVQLFARLFTKDNLAILIWLFANMLIITVPATIWLGWVGLLFGIGLFILSFGIALSPIGEFYLRFSNGCERLYGKKLGKKRGTKFEGISNRITPLFENVYQKARIANPDISPKIKLYYNADECPNAFATGRKTICITDGLLELPDNEIEAVLSHEFGHLSHKDTDLLVLTLVSNLPLVLLLFAGQIYLSVIILIVRILVGMINGDSDGWFFKLMTVVVSAPFIAVRWVWNKLGTLCLRHSMRKHEYQADNFAVDLGYHDELVDTLMKIDNGDFDSAKGLMAALMSTHPETPDRIASMQAYATDKKNQINY